MIYGTGSTIRTGFNRPTSTTRAFVSVCPLFAGNKIPTKTSEYVGLLGRGGDLTLVGTMRT